MTGDLYIEVSSAPSRVVLNSDGYAGEETVFDGRAGILRIRQSSTSSAKILVNPEPSGANDAYVNFFDETDVSGTCAFRIYDGASSPSIQHTFNAGTGNVDLCQQAGELTVGGSVVLPTRTVTSSTDTPTGRDHVILCDATSNTVTINLPTAVGIEGRIYNIKAINVDNAVTVDANGTEEIDGSATAITLALMEVITIQSDGSNWWII